MEWNNPLFSTVIPMATVLALVIISQAWANSLKEPAFLGLLGLVPQRDPSYFFGSIQELPIPLIKAIALTAAGFATFLYAVVQWAISTPSPLVRTGLSWILGAALGGAIDRAADGFVSSYFVVGTPHLHTPPLNLGDAFLAAGASLALAGAWINSVHYGPGQASRGGFWVNPRFQLRYCGLLVLVGGAFSAVLGGFGYIFLKAALDGAAAAGLLVGPVNQAYLHEVVRAFGLMATFLSACFMAALVFIGLIHSHRIAGPVYAFERFFEDLMAGKKRRLKLRNGDEFMQLERIATELSARLAPAPASTAAAGANVRPLRAVEPTVETEPNNDDEPSSEEDREAA